jgi:pyruvate, water dikinase
MSRHEKKSKSTIAQGTSAFKGKIEYFVHQLAESIAKVAAALYLNQVILRMSDFITNVYSSLISRQSNKPKEENPMMNCHDAST